jgi:acyl carrier protein
MSTLETLRDILVEDYRVDREQIQPDAPLSALALDSLSVLELMFKIEDHFHLKIPDDGPTNFVTVNDVVRYIDGLLSSGNAAEPRPKPG